MPSKNKKSGQRKAARKAGRSKKEKQPASLDAKMEHLEISGGDDCKAEDEALLLDKAIKLATAEKEALKGSTTTEGNQIRSKQCHHGYVPTREHIVTKDFSRAFLSALNSGHGDAVERIDATCKAIAETYPGVWHDQKKLKMVVSMYLWQGTQHVLKGDIQSARLVAFSACSLQRQLSVLREDPPIGFITVVEMFYADEHTLVRYLRKCIPCSCLDEKYKEVKCITKLGFCCNILCSKPDRIVDRKSMLRCTGCGYVNYCSRECQKAHWPEHKKTCGMDEDEQVHQMITESTQAEAIREYAEATRRLEEEYMNEIAKVEAKHQTDISRIQRNAEVVKSGCATLAELHATIDGITEEAEDIITLAHILAINLGSQLEDLLKQSNQHLGDDALVQKVDAKAAELRHLQWYIAENSV